jgi:hypothetical protein
VKHLLVKFLLFSSIGYLGEPNVVVATDFDAPKQLEEGGSSSALSTGSDCASALADPSQGLDNATESGFKPTNAITPFSQDSGVEPSWDEGSSSSGSIFPTLPTGSPQDFWSLYAFSGAQSSTLPLAFSPSASQTSRRDSRTPIRHPQANVGRREFLTRPGVFIVSNTVRGPQGFL